ncbi:hypothetical protein MC885_003390, partial [Smutsia gigantea]
EIRREEPRSFCSWVSELLQKDMPPTQLMPCRVFSSSSRPRNSTGMHRAFQGRPLQWTQAIFQHLFTRIPSKLFHIPMLAFGFIHFCKDSLPLFGRNRGILRLRFPSLCKSCSTCLGQWGAGVSGGTDTLRPGCTLTCPPGSPPTLLSLQSLAWNNPPLTSEFMVLLPALADTGTAVEMLPALLDLLDMTVAMDSTSLGPGSPACLSLSRTASVALGRFQSPRGWSPGQDAVMFQGHLSSPTASEKPLWDASFRAPSCLEALLDPHCQPLFQYLLRATASGTTDSRGHSLATLRQLLQPLASCAWVGQCSQALPTLLQAFLAVTKESPPPSLSHFDHQHAHVAVANQLALLLLERSNSLYQVPQYDAQVHRTGIRGPEALGGFRRCVGASISLLRAEAALLDLLVPGVPLLLSKMTTLARSPALSSVRCEGPSGAVCMWATELLNLLNMPSVAHFMFTASMELSQPRLHHDDSTALPLALRIVIRLVEKEAGLLPGEGPVTR